MTYIKFFLLDILILYISSRYFFDSPIVCESKKHKTYNNFFSKMKTYIYLLIKNNKF